MLVLQLRIRFKFLSARQVSIQVALGPDASHVLSEDTAPIPHQPMEISLNVNLDFSQREAQPFVSLALLVSLVRHEVGLVC
jgi:hypothetical protein